MSLLEVQDLQIAFKKWGRLVKAVNGISFKIRKQETVGLVGESGAGKSITALCLMGLLPPSARVKGKILFEGEDISHLDAEQTRRFRGRQIAMIFQDPSSALNPVFSVGEQVSECLRYHYGLSAKEAQKKVVELFERVGIPAPASRFHAYPHQLSGGLKQRVMIAMALALQPKLLIADEPTTALDVTVQSQILRLFQQIKQQEKISLLFISHDLAVVNQLADRIIVMYAGMIVEKAKREELLTHPLHPYTKGLLRAIPELELLEPIKRPFPVIPGEFQGLKEGCPFYNRCSKNIGICLKERPTLKEVSSGHYVACHLYS